jgi:hypothetical protein
MADGYHFKALMKNSSSESKHNTTSAGKEKQLYEKQS